MSSRATLSAALFALLAVWLRGPARTHVTELRTYEDIYYLPPAWSLPVLSLGHDAAVADVLWIRSLIYIGDEFGHRGGLDHVFDYTEAILSLDPDFEAVYHWIASAGMYQPTDVGRGELMRTIEILTRGVERMPESGLLQWDLGATYAFESSPYAESDAERDEWRLRGVEHLMIATRLGAAPPWMVLSNSSMLMRVGAAERAAEHLEEMYATIDDPAMQEQVALRIAELRGDAHASALTEEAERAEMERLRAFPYMHPHLYFLVGPRPPVDVDSALRDGFGAHAFDDELLLEED